MVLGSSQGILGLNREAAPEDEGDEGDARTHQQYEVLDARLFAEEEVVDDEEEVFPRGHNHLDSLLQQQQQQAAHLLFSGNKQHMLSQAGSSIPQSPTQLSPC